MPLEDQQLAPHHAAASPTPQATCLKSRETGLQQGLGKGCTLRELLCRSYASPDLHHAGLRIADLHHAELRIADLHLVHAELRTAEPSHQLSSKLTTRDAVPVSFITLNAMIAATTNSVHFISVSTVNSATPNAEYAERC